MPGGPGIVKPAAARRLKERQSGIDRNRVKTARSGSNAVIRQAISCDVCGTEKKQTNHWFVAYEAGGELRVSGWNSRNRLRPGTKHLCGQTCLHKLMDDFMARTLQVRAAAAAAEEPEAMRPAAGSDTSLTAKAAYQEDESSAQLTPLPPALVPARTPLRSQPELITMPGRPRPEDTMPVLEEAARLASRSRRIEAWEREREREMRAVGIRPENPIRRRSGA